MEEKNKLELPIDSVIVLTDGAIISHLGKLDLKEGEQTVTLTKISRFLDEDSIKVTGKGKITLIDVVPRYFYEKLDDKDLSEIEVKIKKLKEELKEKEAEVEVTNQSIDSLDELIHSISSQFGEWGIRKGMEIDQFNAFYVFYSEQAEANRKSRLKLNKKIEDLQKEIRVLESRMNQLSQTKDQYYEIDVTLDVTATTKIELEVSYSVGNVWWNPLYMVDLSKERANIQRLARITNKSGFDWNNVSVVISTSNRIPVEMSEVHPFYVGLQPEYKSIPTKAKRSVMRPQMGMEASMPAPTAALGGGKIGRQEPEEEMEIRTAQIDISETGQQTFEIKGKNTIESSKEPKTLHLDAFELPLERMFYWASTNPKVVLTHELENEKYFLLPGKVKVFLKGEYISQTTIPLIHPKEKFELGVVESFDLKIEKELVKREVSKKGMIKGKRVMDFGYEIKMKNFKEESVKLKIVDRIPHSTDENVNIELNNIKPVEPEKKNQNVFEWELNLKGSEELKILYDFTVTFPQDRKLQPRL